MSEASYCPARLQHWTAHMHREPSPPVGTQPPTPVATSYPPRQLLRNPIKQHHCQIQRRKVKPSLPRCWIIHCSRQLQQHVRRVQCLHRQSRQQDSRWWPCLLLLPLLPLLLPLLLRLLMPLLLLLQLLQLHLLLLHLLLLHLLTPLLLLLLLLLSQ